MRTDKALLLALCTALGGCGGSLGWGGPSGPGDPIPPRSLPVVCLQTGGDSTNFDYNAPCFLGEPQVGDTECVVQLTVRDGTGAPNGQDITTGHLLVSPSRFNVPAGRTQPRQLELTSLGLPQAGIDTVYVTRQTSNCGSPDPEDCPKQIIAVVNLSATPCPP